MEAQQEINASRQARDICGRVTKAQKAKLIEFMAKRIDFARGLFVGPNGAEENKRMWRCLSAELNACGGGTKTTDQWKKCWQDMKNSVKKLEVRRKKFASKTGGGNLSDPDAPRKLTSIESDILNIISRRAIEGDEVTPEGGFGQPSTAATVSLPEFSRSANPVLPGEVDDVSTAGFTPPAPKRSRQTFRSLHEEALNDAKTMHTESLSRMDKLIEGNSTILKAIENTQRTQLQLCESINKLVEVLKK